MDALNTIIQAVVVAFVGLLIGLQSRGIRTELKGEISALRTEFKDELRGEIAELRKDIRSLQSDLTYVAVAVGARTAGQTGPHPA